MKWDIKRFGSIEIASVSIENNQQEINIKFKKNWNKIDSLDCYYEAREWVRDRRGTTTLIYDRIIKRTNYRRIKDVKNENILKTQIKLADVPGSFKKENVEIQWYLMFRANLKNGESFKEELKTEVFLNPN